MCVFLSLLTCKNGSSQVIIKHVAHRDIIFTVEAHLMYFDMKVNPQLVPKQHHTSTVKLRNHVSWFAMLQTFYHTYFIFEMENCSMSIL